MTVRQPASRALVLAAYLVAAGAGLSCPASAAAARAEASQSWIDATLEAAEIGALSLSPDGRLVAFRTTRPDIAANRYGIDWYVIDLGIGHARSIASGGEALVRDPGIIVSESPIWSPDSNWIHYRALVGGEVQLWRAAADGSGAERLSVEPGDVEQVDALADGSGIRIGIGPDRAEIDEAEQLEYDRGIFVDEHVDPAQNLFRGAILAGRPRTQRLTGIWFERTGILGKRPFRYRRLSFGPNTTFEDASGAPDIRSASQDQPRSERGELASFAWANGKASLEVRSPGRAPIACTARACRSERIAWTAWRPGRPELLFATSSRSYAQTLWRWDLVRGTVDKLLEADGLVGGGGEQLPCAVTVRAAICVTAAAGAPPRLQSIDLDGGRRRSLFDPNAGLRVMRWPTIERLEWDSAEGKSFTAIMFLPDGTHRGRRPLFLNYYRCESFVRGGVGDEWPFAAFAAEGIISVCINAASVEGPQDGVGQYRVALEGIRALVDLLDQRRLVDRRRIGIGGLSFGSEVAMWTAINSDLLAAISVASPQFEPAAFWFNGLSGRDYRAVLKQVWGLGAPDETPGRWQLVSPALNTHRIRAPLLMQLAEQESRFAIELHARLSHSGAPVELYAFPDEPHIKVQPRHRFNAYRRNLDWFRFWLLGREDPDPAKARQFQRWRALKAKADASAPTP